MRTALVIALVLTQALAGCLPQLPFGKGDAPVSPVTGDVIEVTSLDAPADPAAEPGAGADVEAAAPDTAPADTATDTPAPDPVAPEAAETPVPAEAIEAKSAVQLACERRGGRYAASGASGARGCVQPTRDGGKQCRKQTDCEGMCLARSNSCAPVAPLFGCNDILQADGRRVTLCID